LDRGDAPEPEEALAAYAQVLAEGIGRALPGWVVRSVTDVMTAFSGAAPAAVREAAVEAGARAQADLAPAVRRLLDSDVDQQTTTPLALVREAVRYPTEVLHQVGVPPVARDAFAARAFPDDRYDLTPASLADLDPDLAEPALAWGAAKAFVHKQRHEGRR
jgi:hypothetical protein